METLSDYSVRTWARRNEEMDAMRRDTPLGIACDNCGGELVRPAPHMVLTSNPPQMQVKCPTCGYFGSAPL